MRLAGLYTLAGVFWALLLGPVSGLALFAFGAGVAWLFLFGDEPWPQAAGTLLLALSLACGLAVAAASLLLLRAYGKREEARSERLPAARRKALALALLPVLMLLVLGAAVAVEALRYEAGLAKATAREAAFAQRLAERQRIARMEISQQGDDSFSLRIRIVGEAAGDHLFTWQVRPGSSAEPLLTGVRRLRLAPGAEELELSFKTEELAAAYRDKVLKGGGKVLVDEPFRLSARLEPHLGDAERAELPPGEITRLDQGDSPLTARASTDFPVRFIIE